MRPLRVHRLAVLEEQQQVGNAVRVDVGNRSNDLPRRRIEFLDEIDLVVEVAVELASNQRAVVVELIDIGSAVEVRIEGDADQLSVCVVRTPDVRPSVVIAILSECPSARQPDRCEGRQKTDRKAERDSQTLRTPPHQRSSLQEAERGEALRSSKTALLTTVGVAEQDSPARVQCS